MGQRPTASDFEELLRRICEEGVEALGRRTAKITAEAAAKGALSNTRIIFLYTDALEEFWKRSADRIMTELRRWTSETKLKRALLREVAERALNGLAAEMVEMSRVRRAARAFSNQSMLEPAKQKVEALGPDITFRLRQFDIDMDIAASSSGTRRKRVLKWLAEHFLQIVLAVIIAGIIAALGLN